METTDLLIAGREAFSSQDWAGAVDALGSAGALPPDASEALATARWWLDDPGGAIAAWEDAYNGTSARTIHVPHRGSQSPAREYTSVFGNAFAANGWLQLAADALRDDGPSAEHGWIALAEAERTHDPAMAIAQAERALETARAFGDTELEIHALSALGLGRVRQGRISDGMDHLDAALAAATAGGGHDPRVLGDVFCDVVEACTLTADMSRVERWLEVFNTYMERHRHPPLLSFCMVCDAEDQLQKGEWDKAEGTLVDRSSRSRPASSARAACTQRRCSQACASRRAGSRRQTSWSRVWRTCPR